MSSYFHLLAATSIAAASFSPADLVGESTLTSYISATDSTIYSSGSTEASVGDAINGTVTDTTGSGNDATGAGVTLREDANGYRCFRVDDDTVSMDLGIPLTLPSDFTIVYSFNRGTANDNLGYTIGSSGQNKGLALLQNSATSPAHIGITATQDELSFNNKVYGSPTKKTFHDVIDATGTCIALQEFSGVTGVASTAWGIGHGSFKLKGDYYDIFFIDRHLTPTEKANLITYMASKYGEDHKGTPYATDIAHLKGQSPIVGAANDGTISSPAMLAGNKSINYKIDINSLSYPLADPINNNTLGQSIVPAFANRWFQRTGRPICSVMSASGGSTLLPYTTSDWGTTGALLAASKTNIDEAVAALELHANYTVNAIYDVYSSGNTEVLNWNGTTIEDTNFRTAMESLADDAKTWYDANHPGLFQGTYTMMLTPRYNDASARGMQFIDLTSNTNKLNTAIVNAASDTANLTVAWKGGASHFALSYQTGWNYDGVHRGTRGVQETGALTADGIVNSLADPTAPTSTLLGSDLFMDDSQSSKNTRTESVTTASGTGCLMIPVSGHLFSNGSGQIDFDVYFDGVKMSRGASIEVEDGSAGETGSALFYLNEDMFGGSLSAVTGDVVVNSVNISDAAKTLNVLNFAALYHADAYRPERVEGNIDLKNNTTATHDIEPLLDSFLVNVTAGNLDSATSTTATVTNLTELYDSSYTITSLNKTAQFVVAYGSTTGGTEVSPSVVFGASQKEIAPFTVAMRKQITGE